MLVEIDKSIFKTIIDNCELLNCKYFNEKMNEYNILNEVYGVIESEDLTDFLSLINGGVLFIVSNDEYAEDKASYDKSKIYDLNGKAYLIFEYLAI